jgi:hypothetical protein
MLRALHLCNLESIFGQLYPATLLARLVTLQLAGTKRTNGTGLTMSVLEGKADFPVAHPDFSV